MNHKEQILSVCFLDIPKVCIRVIEAGDSPAVIKNKKKYPFELRASTDVEIVTNRRTFVFKIQTGYTWNGADIPKTLFIVGQSKDNNYLCASLIHDWLLEFKHYVRKNLLKNEIAISEYRRLTSLIFRQILKDQGTNTVKANIMAFAVDIFQALFNKKEWKPCN